jgi:large subunit ribosomal protein L31
MKDGIHPNYRDVAFIDQSNGFQFVTRSTVQSKESIEIDGKKMPLVKL